MNKYITKLPKYYNFNDLEKCVYDPNKILPFIEASLQEVVSGGYSLAEPLLQNDAYKKGVYYSFIPKDKSSDEYLYNFDFGMASFSVIRDLAVKFIIEHLNSREDAICIAHGAPAKLTDGWIKKHVFGYPDPFFVINKDHLYYLINDKNKSVREGEELLKRSHFIWPRQMVFFTYSSRVKNVDKNMSELSDADIKELAENADKMLINAYDFNWYIFWELHPQSK